MQSVEGALAELSRSILFEDGFPKWIQSAGADRIQKERSEASLRAIERARDEYRHLQNLVQFLGEQKYEPSVPVLTTLWRTCSLIPVRTAAGHALIEIGSNEALGALEESLTDTDHFSRHMAVKAIFIRTPESAFDRLSPYLESGECPDLAFEILSFLQRDLNVPGWPSCGTPLLDQDNRWLEQCAKLRHDSTCGYLARELLRTSPQDAVNASISRARNEEERTGLHAPPRVVLDGALLRRYRAGEFDTVWSDIHSAGDIGGDYYAEVLEVADATMTRVAENADVIAEKLASHGWRALSSEHSNLRTPPLHEDLHVVDRIERVTREKLPPTLKAFWRIVGGINWVWDYRSSDPHPSLGLELPLGEMDPLCVDPPKAVSYVIDEWELDEPDANPELAEPLVLELAPDHYHKANISGGSPYSILLPTKVADPIFEYEPHRLPFTDYLRLAFDWCGFPGLEEHAGRADVSDFLDRLGKNSLVPF